MNVFFSLRSQRDVERIETWWRSNRKASPQLFSSELREAISLLQVSSRLSASYEPYASQGIRRVILRRTRYHLYFRELNGTDIEIVAIWSAVRGAGPRL